MKRKVICDYCGNEVRLVDGKELYPHRPDLANVYAWKCDPCEASVGCHKNSKDFAPLGRLANKNLKEKNMAAHAAFDPLWKGGFMKRKEAYAWLASELGIDFKDCHIGMFNEEMCDRVIETVQKFAQ